MLTHKPPRTLAVGAVVLATLVPVLQGQTTGPQLPRPVTDSMYGPDLFKRYCASCHGQDGRGAGPVASALKTRPSDLTSIRARNGGVFPAQVVESFITGGALRPAHGSADMPVWGPIFQALDRSDVRVKVRISSLVSHIESIQQK